MCYFTSTMIVLYRLSTSNHNCGIVSPIYSRIVLYRLSTSNHNQTRYGNRGSILSYIVFLHQTTTLRYHRCMACQLSYIVFLHQTTTIGCSSVQVPALSYIVFLHQTTTFYPCSAPGAYCLISSFYIKPQQECAQPCGFRYCLISSFYIKPQPTTLCVLRLRYCLISSFYIKPQQLSYIFGY